MLCVPVTLYMDGTKECAYYYNYEREIPHFTHLLHSINDRRCAEPGCRGYSSFAFPGSKEKFCAAHRREGMVPSGRGRASAAAANAAERRSPAVAIPTTTASPAGCAPMVIDTMVGNGGGAVGMTGRNDLLADEAAGRGRMSAMTVSSPVSTLGPQESSSSLSLSSSGSTSSAGVTRASASDGDTDEARGGKRGHKRRSSTGSPHRHRSESVDNANGNDSRGPKDSADVMLVAVKGEDARRERPGASFTLEDHACDGDDRVVRGYHERSRTDDEDGGEPNAARRRSSSSGFGSDLTSHTQQQQHRRLSPPHPLENRHHRDGCGSGMTRADIRRGESPTAISPHAAATVVPMREQHNRDRPIPRLHLRVPEVATAAAPAAVPLPPSSRSLRGVWSSSNASPGGHGGDVGGRPHPAMASPYDDSPVSSKKFKDEHSSRGMDITSCGRGDVGISREDYDSDGVGGGHDARTGGGYPVPRFQYGSPTSSSGAGGSAVTQLGSFAAGGPSRGSNGSSHRAASSQHNLDGTKRFSWMDDALINRQLPEVDKAPPPQGTAVASLDPHWGGGLPKPRSVLSGGSGGGFGGVGHSSSVFSSRLLSPSCRRSPFLPTARRTLRDGSWWDSCSPSTSPCSPISSASSFSPSSSCQSTLPRDSSSGGGEGRRYWSRAAPCAEGSGSRQQVKTFGSAESDARETVDIPRAAEHAETTGSVVVTLVNGPEKHLAKYDQGGGSLGPTLETLEPRWGARLLLAAASSSRQD